MDEFDALTETATDAERDGLVKAYIMEAAAEVQPSNAAASNESEAAIWTQYGALVPPYDPGMLSRLFEKSGALRPNVDVYRANIEGLGYRVEPTIDLEDPEVDGRIQDAIMLTKIFDGDPTPDVPETEVAAVKLTLGAQIRRERLELEQFFSACAGEISFTELRKRLRHDLEVTGNAYCEVLRDRRGRVAQLVYIPSISMRLMAADVFFTDMSERQKVGALAYRSVKVKRRLRRYVQVIMGNLVAYFKELDDPRVMSARTGMRYPTVSAMRRNEPNAPLASEVIHMKIHASSSAYGVPRWVGASLAVLGSRAAEEVNFSYFDNKAVPPMAILVSGGKLTDKSAEKIQNYIRDNLKGRDNFHKIMVLEAAGAGGTVSGAGASPRVRVEMKSLMDSQNSDALFQGYDQRNIDKVGAQFRIPKILRGDMADFNRSTAEAALQYAEAQVFTPERQESDDLINRRIFPLLDARFHRFMSNGVVVKDGVAMTTMLKDLVGASIITPAEARPVAADALGRTLPTRDDPWLDAPPALVAAGLLPATENGAAATPETKGDFVSQARELVTMRMQLREVEDRADKAALLEARKGEARETHLVPREVWDEWFPPS